MILRPFTMTVSRLPAQIVELYHQRVRAAHPLHARLVKVRDLIGPDAAMLPLPELDRSVQSTVANIARLGLEQLSMRVASTMPTPKFTPVRVGSERAKTQARLKQDVTLAWWDACGYRLQVRRRARHFWGFASSPVLLRPDFGRQIPRWHVRDPLATFPAPRIDRDDPVPDDCIFTFTATWGWLLDRYGPGALAGLRLGPGCTRDTKFTIVEYVDAEQFVQIVLGKEKDDRMGSRDPHNLGDEWKVLEWYPNRCERPVAVVPEAITLGDVYSRFESLPGLYYQQAYLNAINIEGVKKGIIPTTWIVARPNENAEIEQVPDPLQGIPGQIRGADIEIVQLNPGYKTDGAIAQGERAQRIDAGVPAEFGGESTSTVRTGRRGDAILEQAVDFPVQEVQEIFEASMEAEIRIAISQDFHYFASTSISLYPRGRREFVVTHSPTKLWDTDEVHVRYSMAGTDLNRLVVLVGQLLGMELISPEEARELLPLIEDADRAHDSTIVAGIERALLAAVQQKVADPSSPYTPGDVGFLLEQISTRGATLPEAVDRLETRIAERQQREMERQQAGLPPAPAAEGVPVEPQPTVPPTSEGQNNLAQMLNQMRTARNMAGPRAA